MNEPLELEKTEEPLAQLTAELLSVESPRSETLLSEAMTEPRILPAWLRLAYAVEFLIALIAILSVWSEVGGQGHLDLMPWHIKLACVFGLAWCCVRFTAGLVEQKDVWTRRTIAWFAGILLFGIAIGGITYYYHLHEDLQDDDEDATAASARIPTPGVFRYDAHQGRDC